MHYASLVGSKNSLGGSDCQSMALGPTPSTLPMNRLEMHLIRPHLRPTDQKLWGWGPGSGFLASHPDGSPALARSENHWSNVSILREQGLFPLQPCQVIKIFFWVLEGFFTTHMPLGSQWVCPSVSRLSGIQGLKKKMGRSRKILPLPSIFSNECPPLYDSPLQRECGILVVSFPLHKDI